MLEGLTCLDLRCNLDECKRYIIIVDILVVPEMQPNAVAFQVQPKKRYSDRDR